MKNTILLLFSCLFVLTSCNQEEEINSELLNTNMIKSKAIVIGERIIVVPSGDITGVTDATNIENALASLSPGGTVYLTVGNYYISKNIVVDGFNGTLRGESMDNTLIYAGRKSESIGFEPAFNPFWAEQGSANPSLPIVLQFDNSVGDVVITDLSIILKDEQPTDIQDNYYGMPSTYMQSFIEILGGEHNTIVENVRLVGMASLADGNWNHMNVESGIHVMLGPPNTLPSEKGNLTVKNVEVENIGGGAILFMKYQEGSNINVDGVMAQNVQFGLNAGGIINSTMNISNMDILMNSYGFGRGILLWNIHSSSQIMHNTISGGKFVGILLNNVNNAVVFENKFVNLDPPLWGSAIFLVGSNENSIYRNNYEDSNLPGWNSTTDGTGAISLLGNTNDNYIHEMKFPENLENISLCQMIQDRTDDPISSEYDGNNEIHNWRACENSPKYNFSMLEPKFNSNSRFHISKTD